ncbi:IS200/IS605 family transposase [Gloeobacter morelensis]|uniref:IS200/IS605 family transposase n=1 Tax=Gloeobacter morelensis MG652769 TaxID=2781736 RepID=A0ABY3PS65_9CYAN|nr:IS200/IS605 family transposase [Gloeobacter morelensis]UFP96505.1 IS200/IS605 family transposase [Gloeobacter morelensis MG652769]
MQQLRRGRHSVSAIYVHLVFVVKYRRKIFQEQHSQRMHEIFAEVGKSMGFTVLEVNGEPDHVHLLVEHPPKYSVSTLVNHLKGVSSRLLRKEFGLSPSSEHLWSPSYFAASWGGAPIEVIRQYIEQQGEKPP